MSSNLEIVKILQKIEHIKNDLGSIHLYFVERLKGSEGYNYISYSPSLCSNLNGELSTLLMDFLLKTVNGKSLCEFNPLIYEELTLEFINSCNIPNFNKIYESIELLPSQSMESVKNFSFSDIWFYCVKLEAQSGENIILFKKYSHSRALKSGFTLFLNNGTLNKIDNNIISIEDRSDAFYLDNNLYVLNRYFFELIFNLSDAYKDVLENALSKLEQCDIIEGFDDFKEACLDSNQIAKKFTRIMREGGLETFINHINSVPAIINDFNLNIQFRNRKLIYEDKTSLSDIIKLLSNDFVEAALNKQKYEAPLKKPI